MSPRTDLQTKPQRIFRTSGVAAALVLGVIGLTACGEGATDAAAPAKVRSTVAPTATPPTATPPTTAPTPTATPTVPTPTPSQAVPTPPPPAPTAPQAGDTSEAIRSLQEQLKALRYDPGAIDGSFGEATRFALYAFQKVNGLKVDGQVGPEVVAALAKPRVPVALVPSGGANRVEVDRTHQLMYVYVEGELALITHISTGSGKSYCVQTECYKSVTPTGDFKTTWRVNGWRTAPLGRIYKPVYFNGGIAVHGYPSVPLYPASHGCVRIPMHTADLFPKLVGTDWPVYVRAAK